MKTICRIKNGKITWPIEPCMDHLIGYWRFDTQKNTDKHRTKVLDLSGKKNDCKLYNFNCSELSGFNEGLIFDGIDDGGGISLSNLNIDSKHDWSFSIDFNVLNINTVPFVPLVLNYADSYSSNISENFLGLSATMIRVAMDNGNTVIDFDLEQKELIIDWTKNFNLVLQYNSNVRKYYIYINSNKVREVNQNGSDFHIQHILLGGASVSMPGRFKLNYVKIWDTVLSEKTIKEMIK